MWNVKVIPIITDATESLFQIFQKYFHGIPGKYSHTKLQKMVILGIEHILGKTITALH